MSANIVMPTDLRRHPEIADRGGEITLHRNQPQRQERMKLRGYDGLLRRLRRREGQLSTASATNSGDASDGWSLFGLHYTCPSLKNADCQCLALAMPWLGAILNPLREDEAKGHARRSYRRIIDAQIRVELRHRVTHGRLAKSYRFAL